MSLHDLSGVVCYKEQEDDGLGVGHTLYLGEEEVTKLKAILQDGSATEVRHS